MKLLYFTDTHIRNTSPQNRIDDFPETLENKFLEIKEIANTNNVDFILHGGDLFDRPDANLQLVAKFANIIKSYEKPFYSISGNHDLYGHNISTINRTVYGLLSSLGIINHIDMSPTILYDGKIKIALTGKSYSYDVDEDIKNYIIETKEKDCNYHIHMVHGLLLEKPFMNNISHTLIDDIISTNADITLVGHYHTGFKMYNANGKYIINPGSLVRLSNSLSDRQRIPQVVLIELEHTINIQFIKLKTALPGSDVLSIANKEETRLMEIEYQEFKASLERSINSKTFDLFELIKEMSNSEDISEEIRNEAIERLSAAYHEVQDK